jgi:hypothetical protein
VGYSVEFAGGSRIRGSNPDAAAGLGRWATG